MNPIEDLLSKYGGRAYYVLKAALEVAEENREIGLSRLGDFDYRSLVRKLKSWGIEYNPSNLLKVIEKEYGLVRTSYRSSNQRWWVFTDISLVKLALEDSRDEPGDPEEELLAIQIAVLDVDKVIAELTSILTREKISPTDEKKLKEIVLNDLPPIIEVYKKATNYGSKFSDFIGKTKKALDLARKAALLVKSGYRVSSGETLGESIDSRLPTPSRIR
ncbi:MAG: hypothetical protein QW503_07655 [Sulfolobales archaeon]